MLDSVLDCSEIEEVKLLSEAIVGLLEEFLEGEVVMVEFILFGSDGGWIEEGFLGCLDLASLDVWS
jgi:hypothetical protein